MEQHLDADRVDQHDVQQAVTVQVGQLHGGRAAGIQADRRGERAARRGVLQEHRHRVVGHDQVRDAVAVEVADRDAGRALRGQVRRRAEGAVAVTAVEHDRDEAAVVARGHEVRVAVAVDVGDGQRRWRDAVGGQQRRPVRAGRRVVQVQRDVAGHVVPVPRDRGDVGLAVTVEVGDAEAEGGDQRRVRLAVAPAAARAAAVVAAGDHQRCRQNRPDGRQPPHSSRILRTHGSLQVGACGEGFRRPIVARDRPAVRPRPRFCDAAQAARHTATAARTDATMR